MITVDATPALAQAIRPTARLHLNSPHTYFGEPETTQTSQALRSEMSNAMVEERYYYINHTHLPITIMRRDGLPMTIVPSRSQTSSDFIIRKVLILKGNALASATSALAGLTELDSSELEELRKAFKHLESLTYREASIMLDYAITVKDLMEKGGWLYHYQLDLTVSVKEPLNTPPHPYCSRFLNIGGFGETYRYGNQAELNLKIRYVDHSPTASPKYINLAGKVLMLRPQKDAPFARISAKVNGKRTDLVYSDYLEIFYSANADPNLIDGLGVAHARIALVEARETVGLYDTYDDAANSGNIELGRKEKLAKALHEVELVRATIARDKAALEQEDLRLRRELADAKRELELEQARIARDNLELEQRRKDMESKRKAHDEQLDREKREHNERLEAARNEREAAARLEAQHWRDFYESRSLHRKDQSDMIKFIPTIMLAVVALGTAYLKISSPAKTT